MQEFKLFTLVDITNTGINRVRDIATREYQQQQNLSMLLQAIGLRTQIFDPTVTLHSNCLLNNYFSQFPEDVKGNIWELRFKTEYSDVWKEDDNPVKHLEDDIHGVAIISNLDNSITFPVNIFDTKDNINTRVEIV